jgi:hypothetical protein
MTQRRSQLPLAQEPLAFLFVAEPAAQQLQRDAPAAVDFLGFVDLPHPALAERPDDQIPTEALI